MSSEFEKQNALLTNIGEIKKHKAIIDERQKNIDKLAREILNDLRKIEGWEVMIQSCREHYSQYPDKFFDWCYVRYGEDNLKGTVIEFVKHYRIDEDDYVVLSIALDSSLKEQVEITKNVKHKKELMEQKKRVEKELAEYERLKSKYEKL